MKRCPYSLVERQRSSKPLYAGSNPARGTERRINEKNIINIRMFVVEWV